MRLFEILKMATGKGKKIKWRGQKQEGKTRFQGRKVPPVRLSSLYKGGDKAKGVVTGAKAVLEEVHAQAAATNGTKQSFPEVTRQLMTRLRAFPEQPARKPGWAREVCTWERYERALRRAGADVGVGNDGYAGYLTRKAAPEVHRAGGGDPGPSAWAKAPRPDPAPDEQGGAFLLKSPTHTEARMG